MSSTDEPPLFDDHDDGLEDVPLLSATDDSDKAIDFVQQETKHVRRLRIQILLLLGILAVLLSIVIGCTSANYETSYSEGKFEESSDFLLERIRFRGQSSLTAASNLAASFAVATWHSGPSTKLYIPTRQFDLQAQSTQSLLFGGSRTSTSYDNSKDENLVTAISCGVVYDATSDNNSTTQGSDVVQFPIYQVAPSSNSYAYQMPNSDIDFGSSPRINSAMQEALELKGVVLTDVLTWHEREVLGLAPPQQQVQEASSESAEEHEPISLLVVPMLEAFYQGSEEKPQEQRVMGILMVPFSWGDLLMDIFGDDVRGVHLVLESTCSHHSPAVSEQQPTSITFTYQVDEDQATFLGYKDLHTPYYSFTEKTANLQRDLWYNLSTPDGIMTYAAHEGLDCHMELQVFMSATFRSLHKTSIPPIMTGIIVVTLVLVFVLMLNYGGRVEYRLHTSVEQLAKTQHLINSLFPKDVQRQMFLALEHELANKTMNKKKKVGDADPLHKIHAAIRNAAVAESQALPNAASYACATVMFADIAGFTKWSSGREPANVFLLLETIFDRIDKLAKRLGIFKVETIGDCYMAVCGLPKVRDDHASAMCRFAFLSISHMKRATNRLQRELGGTTSGLALRVGCHSGQVTAGVLRGAKARFQLFGDTVNCASRMESTGTPCKVQISSSTAQCLEEEGKTNWFIEREGGVEAKGKGRMRTFWLTDATTNSIGHMSMSSLGLSSMGGSLNDSSAGNVVDFTH